MSDEIRRLSDALASDPASLVFIPLADALRRGGQPDVALRVILRGLERHAYNADAHDVAARVYIDLGESERAKDEWEMALHLAAGHVGALRGLGFLAFQRGDVNAAERYLRDALER
ncbi:MAG: tetratricopeptide repeat protein, partial [Gemmatimonadaceae bacterium]